MILNLTESYSFDMPQGEYVPQDDTPQYVNHTDALHTGIEFPSKSVKYIYTLDIQSLNEDPDLAYVDTITSDNALTVNQIFDKAWPKAARLYGLHSVMKQAHEQFNQQMAELNQRHEAGDDPSPDEVKATLKFPTIASIQFGDEKIEIVPSEEIFDKYDKQDIPVGLCAGMDSSDITFNQKAKDLMTTNSYIMNESSQRDNELKELIEKLESLIDQGKISDSDQETIQNGIDCLNDLLKYSYCSPSMSTNTSIALEEIVNSRKYSADISDVLSDVSTLLEYKTGKTMRESIASDRMQKWLVNLCY